MKILAQNFETEERRIVPVITSKRIKIEIRTKEPGFGMVNVFVHERTGSFHEDMIAILSRVEKEEKVQLMKSELKITA